MCVWGKVGDERHLDNSWRKSDSPYFCEDGSCKPANDILITYAHFSMSHSAVGSSSEFSKAPDITDETKSHQHHILPTGGRCKQHCGV